jgi:hypothetical protein
MDFNREQLDAAGDWAFPARHTPEHTPGMTLRDWFAGQAMSQGMAVLVASDHNLNSHQLNVLARTAYLAADAMLEARK